MYLQDAKRLRGVRVVSAKDKRTPFDGQDVKRFSQVRRRRGTFSCCCTTLTLPACTRALTTHTHACRVLQLYPYWPVLSLDERAANFVVVDDNNVFNWEATSQPQVIQVGPARLFCAHM
jgi:hypothetical protein